MAMHNSVAVQPDSAEVEDPGTRGRPKLAILGTAGSAYLRARICTGLIKGGFDVDLFSAPVGNYAKLLADPSSELYLFNPDVTLITVDPAYLPIPKTHGSRARLAKQGLGATLLQRTVLPMLHPGYARNVHSHSESLPCMLEAKEEELRADAEHDNIQLSLTSHGPGGEVLIGCQVPPFWRRGKRSWLRGPTRGSDTGRLPLSGLGYRCLVVDAVSHPWMTGPDCDVSCFLSRWTQDYALRAGDTSHSCPDLFVFIDRAPFAAR